MVRKVGAGVSPGLSNNPSPGHTTDYSRRRHVGLAPFSQTAVKSANEIQLNPNQFIFPYAIVVADPANTDFVNVGPSGSLVIRLNAGDSVPFFDVAPADVFCQSNSGTQKVYFIGNGDPAT